MTEEWIKELSEQLQTQDNRSTSDPIFIVYDYEKIPTTSEYTDYWEYADIYDGYHTIGKDKKSLLAFAKDAEIKLPQEWMSLDADELLDFLNKEYNNQLIKNYYIKKKIFVGIFFTEKSAKEFIEANSYHFTKEVFIYVESLWRNREMQNIRNFFLGFKGLD